MTDQAQAIVNAATELDNLYNSELQVNSKMQLQLAAAASSQNAMQGQLNDAKAQLQAYRDLLATQAETSPIFTPTIYTKLHQRPNSQWLRGADVAGLKGNFAKTPNSNGSVSFSVSPDGSYNNFYLYTNLESGMRNPKANKFLQITEVEVLDGAVANCQEVETNFEQTLDNLQYNGGISPLLGQDTMRDPTTGQKTSTIKSQVWRWYDITPGRAGWYELPEIPFDISMFGTGKRIRIESEFVRWDNKMTHVAVTINGKRYEIERTSTAKPQPTWGPHIQHGFQLDTKQTPNAFSVKVWDMECRIL